MSSVDHRPTAVRAELPAPDAHGAVGERSTRATAWVLLVGGLAGAVAAMALLLDKLALLIDPDYVPSCSIDAVLSCGPIMKSPQAEVLGFPNPIIGLVTFPVVAAIGALAVGRTPLPGWCWTTLQLGAVTGLGFVTWLIAQSVAVIGALCPWCMLVWTVTITVFWHVTAHNLAHGRLAAGKPGRLVARRPALCSVLAVVVVLAVLVMSFRAWFAAPFTG